MNPIPNISISGPGNTPIGGVAGASAVSPSSQNAVGSLANQDWFSEQALGQGKSIEAASFDGSSEFSSVEQAAAHIFSRLVPGG